MKSNPLLGRAGRDQDEGCGHVEQPGEDDTDEAATIPSVGDVVTSQEPGEGWVGADRVDEAHIDGEGSHCQDGSDRVDDGNASLGPKDV